MLKNLFEYTVKDDYDKEIKLNNENIDAYSSQQLKKIAKHKPTGEIFVCNRKNSDDTSADMWHEAMRYGKIGKISLANQWYSVLKYRRLNRVFHREVGYIATGGGYLAVLKRRFLPIILIGLLIIGVLGGGIFAMIFGGLSVVNKDAPDIHLRPIDIAEQTVSGYISQGNQFVEGAALSLCIGDTVVAQASSDTNGKYLFVGVENGYYNVVCTYNGSTLLKRAEMAGLSVTSDFKFPTFSENTSVNASVKLGDQTPFVSVGALDEEALSHIETGKAVDVTLGVTIFSEDTVPETDKAAIEAISGQLEMTYYDISVLKELYQGSNRSFSEYLKNTNKVLEIVIPYDNSRSVDTVVFRYHDGVATKLQKLENMPTSDFQEGTYYTSYDGVYIYANQFSTYAVGIAKVENPRNKVLLTFDGNVTVNKKTGEISMLYKHDISSTHNARIELYLEGEPENMLISTSGTILPGYMLDEMTLSNDVKKYLPTVGTYAGIMKLIYFNDNNELISTNTDIHVNVSIIQ